MGAEGPLVGSPVFKTDGDGAPVLVCSIRTRPRQLRTALSARGSAGAAKPLGLVWKLAMCPAARDFGPLASDFFAGILTDFKEESRCPADERPAVWAYRKFSNKARPGRAVLRFQPRPTAQPLAAVPPYGCGVPLAGTALGSRLGAALRAAI